MLAQALHRVAMDRRIAVLVVNQVVSSGDREQTGAAAAALMTSHDGSGGGGGPRLVPALGESWAHACTNRILLEWAPEGHRVARLVKSASRAPGTAAYAVVADGVRSLKSGGAARRKSRGTLACADVFLLPTASFPCCEQPSQRLCKRLRRHLKPCQSTDHTPLQQLSMHPLMEHRRNQVLPELLRAAPAGAARPRARAGVSVPVAAPCPLLCQWLGLSDHPLAPLFKLPLPAVQAQMPVP